MSDVLKAPPGKYRVVFWDNWEISSSSYTLEEAMAPYVLGDYRTLEEAVAVAREKNSGQAYLSPSMRADFAVYDDQGRSVPLLSDISL